MERRYFYRDFKTLSDEIIFLRKAFRRLVLASDG